MYGAEFIRNVSDQSLDALAQCREQYVAWSDDGRKILAYAPSLDELLKEIERLALTDYVLGYVPDPDTVQLGGALDISDTDFSDRSARTVVGRGHDSNQANDQTDLGRTALDRGVSGAG